jgi:hypothetical protein
MLPVGVRNLAMYKIHRILYSACQFLVRCKRFLPNIFSPSTRPCAKYILVIRNKIDVCEVAVRKPCNIIVPNYKIFTKILNSLAFISEYSLTSILVKGTKKLQ